MGQLRKSDSVAVFLCTAGPEIGDHARQLINEKDFLKGYIFDIAGSEIVEAAADKMQEALRINLLAENIMITNRYSPGYCGWHVSEQHKLFTLVPGNYCNISLTDSSLMQPIKSVSGFIGLGGKVRFSPYTCNLCDMQNCIYRNHKNSK
jgi:cobalamin-dependent methionine synthase I